MKKNILIIVLLIAALSGAFTLKAHSQDGHITDTILLADETTLTYNKTEAVIKCSNETIFTQLFKSHGTIFKRFTCTWKTDRHGRYKYYVAYLQKDDAAIIVKWAKNNL